MRQIIERPEILRKVNMEKRKLDELRRRAKEMLDFEHDDVSENTGDDVRELLHELRTYQIELELQNDELRRVQEELVETRDQYIDLYDFAPFGYLTLSEKGVIVKANLTMADLLGEERRLLHDQPFTRFIFYKDQDRFFKNFRAFVASMDRLVFDLRMQGKDGDWFWAKLECVPRTKSEMSGIHIRIALHDITDAKRLENEIVKTKKLEATALLAGGIAHDFNNLLAVIMGNVDLVQEDLRKGRPVADTLQNARNACRQAAALTKKFLTFSSGGDPLITTVPVEKLVTDAVSLALAGSNVDFESFFPEDLWPVAVDVGQMTQAIGNVVTNSREAMLQGGVIRIRAENVDSIPENIDVPNDREAKFVKVSIQDQGGGISEEVLTQVFDPYFTSKDLWNKKGLGLGLTVTYSILKRHGGVIDIASRPDAGTMVSMYLPVSSDRQITDTLESLPRKASAVKKILFMDDEEMLRNVTRSILESLGYEVETACNGEEAIALYTTAKGTGLPFDAVILDLTIKGGLGGRETIKMLRELDPDIKAIVASGYSTDPIMVNFREYGFIDALNKPYRLRELEKSLERIGYAAKVR